MRYTNNLTSSFSDLLSTRVIEKKVDDEVVNISGKSVIPKEIVLENTPLQIIHDDVLNFGKSAEAIIQEVIDVVIKNNANDPVFNALSNVGEYLYQNPATLKKVPQPPPQELMKIVHRGVFREKVDPRAIFINDLQRSRFLVQSINLSYELDWNKFTQSNKLFSTYSNEDLSNLIHQKNRQLIDQAVNSSKNVRTKSVTYLASDFVETLNELKHIYAGEAPLLVNQLRFLLTRRLDHCFDEFYIFEEILNDRHGWGGIETYLKNQNSAMEAGSYFGIKSLSEVLSDIESVSTQFFRFSEHINGGLFHSLQGVEQSLVDTEGLFYEIHEAKYKMNQIADDADFIRSSYRFIPDIVNPNSNYTPSLSEMSDNTKVISDERAINAAKKLTEFVDNRMKNAV